DVFGRLADSEEISEPSGTFNFWRDERAATRLRDQNHFIGHFQRRLDCISVNSPSFSAVIGDRAEHDSAARRLDLPQKFEAEMQGPLWRLGAIRQDEGAARDPVRAEAQ